MSTPQPSVGDLLREWRRRRRLSQLGLALEANVSTRHLSYVESGRALASRDLLLRLADPLTMPLRERNALLRAGGYAPVHREQPLSASDMAAARAIVDAVLAGHAPFPALAVDRHWNLVAANAGLARWLDAVAPPLLSLPVNVLRLSLHPDGLAPYIRNLDPWRHHLLARLRRDAAFAADPVLESLLAELEPDPSPIAATRLVDATAVAVPLLLVDPQTGQTLSLLSTTTVFGTATDVTLAELTLECFYPADTATRAALLATHPPPSEETP